MTWTETEVSKEAQEAAIKGALYCLPVDMLNDKRMQEYARIWAVAGLRAAAPILRREAADPASVLGFMVTRLGEEARPVADWDGVIHPDRADAEYGIRHANGDEATTWFLAEVRAVDVAAMEAAR